MYSIKRGTDVNIAVTFEQNSEPIDITGYTIFFTVKKSCDLDAPDTSAIISQTVAVHSDPTHGKSNIILSHTQTDQPSGNYVFDIKLKNSDGIITATRNDQFIIGDRVTVRTA